MAKRRKKNSPLENLFVLVATLIVELVVVLIRCILLTYDLITIYTSKYKEKSGNGFFKTCFNKGNYGEFKLYRLLTKILGKANVYTNVYLDNINTDKTEVDVIGVSKHGVYVFETKNYSGYIYGSEEDQTWTQVLNKFSKYKFYNPLRQNYAHTKAVEKYLEISEEALIPVIVFSNRSKLSKIQVSENKIVIQMKDVRKFMSKNKRRKHELFFDNEVSKFSSMLIECSNMPQDVKDKHIAEVVKLKESVEQA